MNKYLAKIASLSNKEFLEEYEKRNRPFAVADSVVAGGLLGGAAGYGTGLTVYPKYHKGKATAIRAGKMINFAANTGLAGAAVGGAAAGYSAYKLLYGKKKKK